MVNLNKDREQKRALKLWWNNKGVGTIESATGFGKCRVGVLAISGIYKITKDKLNFKILIVVPTETIKDDWKNEFIKLGFKNLLKYVEIQCINTARKYKSNYYDILILDEIHNYLLGIENSKIYKNNQYKYILGLSATIDNSLLLELNTIAPICYSMDLNTAVELGLVTDYIIYNIGVNLNKEEKLLYNSLTEKIDYYYNKTGKRSWKNISIRKELLYNASNKFKLLNDIVNLFNNDYGIIFSMNKNTSDYIHSLFKDISIPHHSGISKKNRILNLKKFTDGRTKLRIISTAKTIDEGVNLPKVNYSIITSSSSKPKQTIQRIGRNIRLSENKVKAFIIRIYVKNSKEESWIENSQAKLKVINLSSIEELKTYLYDKK